MRAERTTLVLVGWLLWGFLALPALGQTAVPEAKRLADQLAQQSELPVNVRLRFQLLRDMMGSLAGKGDSNSILSFFSTTRVLFWNRPISSETGNLMRAYEAQVAGLAQGRGFPLDLPPVGYSSAGAAGGAQIPVAPNAPWLFSEQFTREGLYELVLRAEEHGTMALERQPSADLLALRDSLTVLRQDLNDTEVASDAVRNVLLTRVRFLQGPDYASAPPELKERLRLAIEALRAAFPPERLRQSRGAFLSV